MLLYNNLALFARSLKEEPKMKILIAYASVTGCSRECAGILADKLSPREVHVVDLNVSFPDPADYDVVVLGAPVRMGRMHKKFREYIKANREMLKEGKYGFFVCGALPDEAESNIKKAIGKELFEGAFEIEYFGGEMKVEKQKGLISKLFVKSVRNKAHESQEPGYEGEMILLPEILPENIARFADTVKAINA